MDKSTGSGFRGAQISALVASLKAGLITKAELFDKLQRLQKGEVVVDLSTNQLVSPPHSVCTMLLFDQVSVLIRIQFLQPELSQSSHTETEVYSSHSRNLPHDYNDASPSHYVTSNESQYGRVNSTRNVENSPTRDGSNLFDLQDIDSNQQIPAPIKSMLKQMREFTESHLNSDDPNAQEYVQQQRALFLAALALEAKKHGYTLPPEITHSDRVGQILSQTQSSHYSAKPEEQYYSTGTDKRRSGWGAGGNAKPASAGATKQTAATPPRAGDRLRHRSQVQDDVESEYDSMTQTERLNEQFGRLGFGDWSATGKSTRITSNTDFADRAMRWREKKLDEMQRLQKLGKDKELEECTFQPKLNKSTIAVARSGGRGDPSTIHERLYERSKTRTIRMKSGGTTDEEDFDQRNGSVGKRSQFGSSLLDASQISTAAREVRPPAPGKTPTRGRSLRRAKETQGTEQDGKEDSSTSKSPAGSRVIDARNVSSRYMTAQATKRSKSNALLEPEYTFKPTVNKVNPETMPAAAIYTSAPIYERLANTSTKAQMERQRAIQQRKEELEQTKVEDDTRRSLSTDRSGTRDLSVEAEERLASFLARQEAAAERKKRNLELIKKAVEPPHAPRLCEMSVQIVERRFGSTGPSSGENFLRRRKEQLLMKEHEVRFPFGCGKCICSMSLNLFYVYYPYLSNS